MDQIEDRPCCCESSLCDHDDRCDRPASGYVTMQYVVDTCTNCAANMCITGGAEYIFLTED